MNIEFEKKKIRKEYIEIRKNIKNKSEKSKIIFDKLVNNEKYINSKVIALYNSLESEVDTNELIEYSLKIGKIVLLPKVDGKELKFYRIYDNEELIKSSFGVLEPIENSKNLFLDKDIDLVIVPGICFDMKKNRLGFGGGFYDRFLSNKNIDNIAICFDEQILINKILPVSLYDISVKKIITDRRVI